MSPEEFVEYVKGQLEEHGVRTEFSPEKWVYVLGEERTQENRCSGYFDDTNKFMAVAMGKKNWLQIMLHEYCHFEQWRDAKNLSTF